MPNKDRSVNEAALNMREKESVQNETKTDDWDVVM